MNSDLHTLDSALCACPSDIGEEDFLLHLEQDPGFTSPHCVENLKSVLGISCSLQPSLLKEIQL